MERLTTNSLGVVSPSPTMRDFVAVLFRRRKQIQISFLAIITGVVIGTALLPKRYESQMKILIKRERADPVVTTEQNAQIHVAGEVTIEDQNSEAELIKSRDLLEKVVVKTGLHLVPEGQKSFLDRLGLSEEPLSLSVRIALAVQALDKKLEVEPIPRSTLIAVRFKAKDPELAKQVLNTLSDLYLEKHVAMHRPAGAFDFFQTQTEEYRSGLAGAERDLARFGLRNDVVSVEQQKRIAVDQLSQFEAQRREAQNAEVALARRIEELQTQATGTPARVTTQVRTSDNAYLHQQLRSTLLSLSLKRTELLTKYAPDFRLVQEVDTQIAQTQAALSQAEKSSLRDESTDLDKTRLWLDEELAKARAELASLHARSGALASTVDAYRTKTREIASKEYAHADLVRAAKGAEENYLLYLRKREEAKIAEALDRKRIVNVAIAEPPTLPTFPTGRNWTMSLALGLTMALLSSVGMAFVADYLDPSFRTPDEVQFFLGIPVIAAPALGVQAVLVRDPIGELPS